MINHVCSKCSRYLRVSTRMRVRTRVIPDGVVLVNTEGEVVHILRWLLDRDVWHGVSRAHTRAHTRI